MAVHGVNPGECFDYVIVGLGNPGNIYEFTKHNIGFKFIDYLCVMSRCGRACVRKLHYSHVNKTVLNGYVALLVKPQTYMNNSGIAVSDIIRFYRESPQRLIVVHDDITLPVGCYKIKVAGSAGGHNGVKSIIEHLGTDDFIHLKIGIGQKPEGWKLSDYVLSKFNDDEYTLIKKRFDNMYQALQDIFFYGVEEAMAKNNPLGKTLE